MAGELLAVAINPDDGADDAASIIEEGTGVQPQADSIHIPSEENVM